MNLRQTLTNGLLWKHLVKESLIVIVYACFEMNHKKSGFLL